MITGTVTGNQTLYYKPGTKLEPGEPNTGETTGKLHLSIDAAYMTDDGLRQYDSNDFEGYTCFLWFCVYDDVTS